MLRGVREVGGGHGREAETWIGGKEREDENG